MYTNRENQPDPHFLDIEVDSEWKHAIEVVESEVETCRLTLCPPHVIYDYLKKLRSCGRDCEQRVGVNEAELLAMDEPLVGMGLAQWGQDSDVLMRLFESHPSGTGERLALFRNEYFGYALFGYALSVKDDEEGFLDQIYMQATRSEQIAIASNSGIYESYLERLLTVLATNQDANEKALGSFLEGVVANDSITTARWLFQDRSLREALWSLAVVLPAEPPWAYLLANIYQMILSSKQEMFLDRVEGFLGQDDLRAALEKWIGAVKVPSERLDYFSDVAMHLARAGIDNRKLEAADCFGSDHIALRCAAFRETPLTEDTAKQLSDSGLIVEAREALVNRSNWNTRQSRNLLLNAALTCWDANRGGENLDFDGFWSNWDRIEAIHKRDYPDWFLDELPDDEPDEEPDKLREEIDRLWNVLNHQDETSQQIWKDMKNYFGLLAILLTVVLSILIF